MRRDRATRRGRGRQVPVEEELRAAVAAFRRNNMYAAEDACHRVLQRDRANVDALRLLAQIMEVHERFDAAASYYRKCLAARPREASLLVALARLSLRAGRTEDALDELDRALALKPDDAVARVDKAFVYDRMGRYADARALLEGLTAPPDLQPYIALCRCTVAHNDGQYELALALADAYVHDEAVPANTRVGLAFLRGQAFDKLGDPERAMESWRLGNRLMQRPFDPPSYRRHIDELIAFFSENMMEALPRSSIESETPVFIAGLPRSGTTLTEQIIDAHPRGFGAGELKDLEHVRNELPERLAGAEPYPRGLCRLTPARADELAEAHLARLAELSGGAARVVDKALENPRLLGMIALLFPRARVIHCRRDPVDNGLSIYMNRFNPAKHPYATDLRHIGFVCRQADRLMEHWRRVLDLPILQVQYEELIGDPEPMTRRIIEFCRLEWDEACLRFHESRRAVMTPSYHQVSRPIYQSAVERWRTYEAHLAPLLEALAEDA
ncbi:MAG: sulfotransferase [Planctomycetota bacterium]|nr:sulfotransferase [Planctomycetota bacterium]